MTTSTVKQLSRAMAHNVEFNHDTMVVTLHDGRQISIPLEWFPRLRDASSKKRANWRLIGKGVGIHWPELDEDISTDKLLVF